MKKRKKSNKKKSNKNITINISNRWIYTIIIFVILILGIVIVNAFWNNPTEAYHEVSDITVIIDGKSHNLQEAIDMGLVGKEKESEIWSTIGNNIYYSGGNVGIGKTSPNSDLDVNGKISTNALSIGGNPIYFKNGKLCYYVPPQAQPPECNSIEKICYTDDPHIYQTGAMWDCNLPLGDLKEDCRKYCINMGGFNQSYNGFIGPRLPDKINPPCIGRSECGYRVGKSHIAIWGGGTLDNCNDGKGGIGELTCKCYELPKYYDSWWEYNIIPEYEVCLS